MIMENHWTPEKIKELRLQLGKSQQAFATLLGVGIATVSRWELGMHKPYKSQIERLEVLASDNRN